VGFDQDSTGQAQQGGRVGEDADDVGAALDFPCSAVPAGWCSTDGAGGRAQISEFWTFLGRFARQRARASTRQLSGGHM
jgi:hypothetical protein